MKKLTVGHLRRLIDGLPDSTPLYPEWADGPPSDHEPGVEFDDIRLGDRGDHGVSLNILVRLFYLDDPYRYYETED